MRIYSYKFMEMAELGKICQRNIFNSQLKRKLILNSIIYATSRIDMRHFIKINSEHLHSKFRRRYVMYSWHPIQKITSKENMEVWPMVSATGNTMTALGILVKNNFSCHFTLNNQEQSSVIQIPLLELIPNQQRKAVIKVWKRREKSRTYVSRKLTIM